VAKGSRAPSTTEQALRFLGLLPLMAAACYGVGWVFFASAYSRVGVSPERVGATSGFITVRAALLLLIALAVGFVIVMLLDLTDLLANAREKNDTKGLIIVVAVWSVMLFGVLAVAIWTRLDDVTSNLVLLAFGVVFAGVAAVLQYYLLMRALNYQLSGDSVPQHLSFGHAAATIVIWAACGIVIAWSAGAFVGHTMESGDPVHFLSINATSACVTTEASGRPCGLYLGGSDGFVVLYQPATDGFVVLLQTAQGAPPRPERVLEISTSDVLTIEYTPDQ